MSAPPCHPACTLGPNVDHPGSREYRCIDKEGRSLPFPGEDIDQPCERCSFVHTPGGECICRVPTDDDVPLWGEGNE